MTQPLHSLLRRQLRRHGVELDALPDALRAFLEAVDRAYQESDDDRLQVERSLELSSQELLSANTEMRALFEALPDVFLKTDSAGNILDCRGARWDIERLPIDPRSCSSLTQLLGTQADRVIDALQRVDETEAQETVQVTFEAEPRSWTYEVRIVPMGRHEQLVVLRDTTERMEAEAALRVSEERFRSLVQNSSDMIVIVNDQGRAAYASPSVMKIMGYEEREWRDLDMLSIIHPDQIQEAAVSLRTVMEEPGVHPPKELLIRHRDGSYRYIDMTAHNLLDVPSIRGIVYNARDITERKQAEDALRESEERFRHLAENSPVGIYQLSAERAPVYLNPALRAMLEIETIDDLAGRPFEGLFSEESLATMREHHARRAEGQASTYEVELIGVMGTRRSVLVSGAPVYDSSGRPLASLGTVTDITERKQAERALQTSEERFRSLVQNASDLIAVIDPDTNFLYRSPSMARVLGDESHQVRGRRLSDMLHPDDIDGVVTFLGEVVGGRRNAAPFEARVRCGDGSWRAFEFVGTDQRLNPAISGFVLNARDVTDRRDLEEQLRHQAFHDPLTGLANRVRFGDRLEHALERAGRQSASVALLFMDVDNFKAINDGMGHSIGDSALQHVARQLQRTLRPGDTAARLGGDEFAILVEDTTLDETVRLAEQVLAALAMPLALDDEEVVVRASIGIAVSNGSEHDADGLLRNADIAMYAAKDAGKARYQVYRPSMRSALLERLTLLRDMERGLERGEFVVEYQPLIDLETAGIVGVEALVRWQHPKLGLLPPAEFIGVAEESGLIVPLGHHVLRVSCVQAKEWQDEYPHVPPRTMSVNVSVKQLQDEDFLSSLLAVLGETGLDPSSLVLEVTESVMLHDAQASIALLEAIRSHGIKIAIDDFGTGYSSLSYLSRFPFDVLKIDKTFIDQTRLSEREGVLTRAIIDLGRTFSVEVVAEGIEDQRELDRLRELHCRIGQGFYFARPGSAQQVSDLLRRESGTARAA